MMIFYLLKKRGHVSILMIVFFFKIDLIKQINYNMEILSIQSPNPRRRTEVNISLKQGTEFEI